MTDVQNTALTSKSKIVEIHKALFSMANNKSPGPDGMNPILYKSYWGTLGQDICAAVQNFFDHPSLSRAVNHTFITLIPKKPTANWVDHF